MEGHNYSSQTKNLEDPQKSLSSDEDNQKRHELGESIIVQTPIYKERSKKRERGNRYLRIKELRSKN